MSRYFNEQEVELLAPAGNFEIFKQVINSGADAVYFGGKVLNMRMHRKDFNFSDNEIVEAIDMAHKLGKKVYITVNNLISEEELVVAKEYLKFLNEAKPDGLIVQDMSIIELINSMNLDLNIHGSVMMNVHNLETVRELEILGVTRVVTSREIDLATIKAWHGQTSMEFEYFTHGDMCIAHGAQCLYSGMIFGQSGSRGRCMKPCRWGYTMNKDGKVYDTTYPMAVKDMYMYENIPELIDSGVVSFKIEGRMRDAEYLINLVNIYSDAIDRYIEDPISYDRKKAAKELFDSRKRDLSTAYAFGNPGLSNINERYEGTGKFYSTGKVFSNPIEEIEANEGRVEEIKSIMQAGTNKESNVKLAVKVNNVEAAMMAIEERVHKVYLSGEVFEPNKPFTRNEIKEICDNKGQTEIYLALPRMTFDKDFVEYHNLLSRGNLGLDGLVVTNLGSIKAFKKYGLPLIGDYALNIYNSNAIEFYEKQGLVGVTLSTESPATNLNAVAKESRLPVEVIVHGSPTVMYMSHDLYENTKVLSPVSEEVVKYSHNKTLILKDSKGYEHPVYKDNRGLNHMLLSKDLCLLPILDNLLELNVQTIRIEGCHYNNEILRKIIGAYKKAMEQPEKVKGIFEELDYAKLGFTFGALQFN